MLDRNRDNLALAAALALSVALHVTLLAPFAIDVLTQSPANAAALQAALDPSPPEHDITLGLEHDSPSTFTWIGYEEQIEHLAKPSDIDQADMTTSPPTGAPPQEEGAMSEAPIEPLRPAAFPPLERIEIARSQAAAPPRALELPDNALHIDPSAPPVLLAPPLENPREESTILPPTPADARDIETIETQPAETKSGESSAATEVAPATPNQEVAAPGSQGSSTNDRTTPPGEDTPPNETQGDITDREADPTSIINVPPDKWKTGKPLAAHGMELKPRGRPFFTDHQLATIRPRNPLCEITFDQRGLCISATIEKTSGHTQIDENIIDWLYTWRATGKPIAALEGTEGTITISIRIVLVEGRDAE